jgi:transposase
MICIAELNGVPLALVDPKDTSRTCPKCGYVDKRNRKSQSEFLCIQCGFRSHADTVAAVIIGRRAAGNQPHAPSSEDVQVHVRVSRGSCQDRRTLAIVRDAFQDLWDEEHKGES